MSIQFNSPDVTVKTAQTRVVFPKGKYTIGKTLYTYESVVMPESTFVDVKKAKNIVESEVAGKRGKVREIIYTNDWEITFRGVLFSGCMDDKDSDNPESYPHDEVMKLRNLFDVDKEIEVEADIFSTIGVHTIVLKSIDLPANEGFKNIQPFTIEAVSDIPYEIAIAQSGNESTLSRDFQIYG